MGGWGGAPHLSDISAALVPPPEPGMVAGKSGSGAGEGGGPGWGGLGLYPSSWFPPLPPLSWTWDCPPEGPSVGPGPWSEFSAHPSLLASTNPFFPGGLQRASLGARTSPRPPTLSLFPPRSSPPPFPNSPREPHPSPCPPTPPRPRPVHHCQCLLLSTPHERPCRLGAGLGWAPWGRGWASPKAPPHLLIVWVLGVGGPQAASGTLGASSILE